MSFDEALFDEVIEKREGATSTEIRRFVETLLLPLTDAECDRFAETYSYDSGDRLMPNAELPRKYLDLLRWSNGGEFRSGRRTISLWPTGGPNGVRMTNLDYGIPKHAPGLLAFASDGGGNFFCFDWRSSGRVGFAALEVGGPPAGFWPIETSFLEVLTSNRRITELCD